MMSDKKILLDVKVQPSARRQEVQKVSDSEYKIRVLSPPIEGKANKEVIEVVASYFHLPASRVKILRGQRSRKKIVVLEGEPCMLAV